MADIELRPYQNDLLNKLRGAFVQGHRAVMLYAPTGGGKCLGRDTPIMLADGSIRPVQDILTGDLLMGDDGTPRRVLSTATGREMLYRVTPTKGDAYVVNASHLLSLRVTPGCSGIRLANGSYIYCGADVVAVRADVFERSNGTAKHCLKGWRADGILAFARDDESDERLMPSYLLGAWLGDGSIGTAAITKPRSRMVDEWIAYGKSLGYGVSVDEHSGRCPTWRLTNGRNGRTFNIIQSALECMGVAQRKHIPSAYKYGPIAERLELLAGLIDSDGSESDNCCDWISKSEELARDFAFVCRSVGLACYLSYEKKGIKSTGFEGWYWRASVSGDLSIIPTRDKPFNSRRQIKRHLVHGISVDPIGEGDYYGFEIDGNKLFLLGDFTVTHNTEMAISLLSATADKGNRSAMVLDRIVLCDQTSARLDKYGIDHGLLLSGHWRYRPDRKIQVCSAQTIEKRGSFPGLNLLIVDEAHIQRDQTTQFIKNNPHIRVIGLSASPFTKGLGSVYSSVISGTTTKQLVDEGWLSPLRVFIAKQIDMTGAKKIAGEWSAKESTERGVKITGDVVAEWVKMTHELFGGPRKTIVFCAGVAHGQDLAEKFAAAGYNFVSISYKDDDEFKRAAIEDFSKPDTAIHGLIATDILSRGFDVSDVMIGVSARPFTKSFASHVQQMGRVMRQHPGKSFSAWLDHSGNFLRFRDQWDALYSEGVSELDDGAEKTKPEPTDKEKEAAKCPVCGALWPRNSDTCIHCGYMRPRRNDVIEQPGELTELSGQKKEKYDSETKNRWFSELLGYARLHGKKDGWAWYKYQERFGVEPPWKKEAITPSYEVEQWIRSRNIAYAKRKK